MTVKTYMVEIEGHKFYRESARTYTHAVVSEHRIADVREQVVARAKREWAENRDYYTYGAQGKCVPKYNYDISPETQAKCQKALAAGEQGYIDTHLERHEERMAAVYKTADGLRFYQLCGWCGRLDLAGKLAAKSATHTFAHILDAVEGAKKPTAARGRAGRVR